MCLATLPGPACTHRRREPSRGVLLGSGMACVRLVLAGLMAAVLGVPGLHAQSGDPPVSISVRDGDGSLAIELGDLFSDGRLRQALHEGLPLRLRVEAALWRDGFFDSQVDQGRWTASLLWDPIVAQYLVQADAGEPVEARSLAEATALLQAAVDRTLQPSEPGRYYYLTTIEVETLSLSDLEELERWLRGELSPAVGGEGDLDGALTRGIGRVLVRALGLPTRSIRLRSEVFEHRPQP